MHNLKRRKSIKNSKTWLLIILTQTVTVLWNQKYFLKNWEFLKQIDHWTQRIHKK